MRGQRIQTIGLFPALLATAVLVFSPVPVATAQPAPDPQQKYLRDFWSQESYWSDETVRKALRRTEQKDRWAVLVSFEEDGRWYFQGFLRETSRITLGVPNQLDETSSSVVPTFQTALLFGEVGSVPAERLHVVAAVVEHGPAFSDAAGRVLLPLVPLYVTGSQEDALQFAQVYQEIYQGPKDLPGEEGSDFEALGVCENACSAARNTELTWCHLQNTACVGAAGLTWVACAAACGGVPPCEGICAALYLALLANCVISLLNCSRGADQDYEQCISNCGPNSPCGAAVTQTATATISLEDGTEGGLELATGSVDFALMRAETRGQESIILDEWAIVHDGQIMASSNPAFARAVTDQGTAPPLGSFLMIQEPVHAMNSRHVAKPEVRISSTGLAPSERGEGELVAARLEFSPAKVVDRVEIVYTSAALDEARLEQLVSQRIGLVFASDKEHRTAVYVIFRLTDRFELLGTFTALPQCCCGEVFCI